MTRTIRHVLFAALSVSALPCAFAQHGTWTEDSDALALNVIVYAGPGHYYMEDIFVRPGQQTIYFQTYPEFSRRMDVKVGNGPWEVLNDDEYTLSFTPWENAPTTPGVYRITVRDWGMGGSSAHDIEYDLIVVPQATRGFSDNHGNTMVFWSGAGGSASTIDKPVLIVEGIDADNKNLHEAYYALGAELFGTGRARGADVIILNFKYGGQDLKDNADVLESAIGYVNSIRTGSKGLVVAGVSMGGVIARYALASMEESNIPHGASHFVSIDAPQQGAVLDHGLVDWIYYSDRDLVPVPANLSSTAGKQLLTYNRFDRSNPSLHDQFYQELNALNGDGYPHQTENVGVSFGASSANPNVGQPNPDVGAEWLEILLPAWPKVAFDIEPGSPEAAAGSFLPLEATELWGRAFFGLFGWEFDRKADPTFIPYASALDIVNGQSKFDGDPITPPESRRHDEFHPDLVEPILTRIGFPESTPPGPLSVSVSGPTSLNLYEQGTWTATVTGGTAPYASLAWAYRYPWGDPEPCDPCIGTMGPVWGDWEPIGLPGLSVSHRFTERYARAQVRLLVTDAAGTTRSDIQEVTLNFARPAGETDALARGTEDAAQRGDTDEAEARSADAESADALTVHASAASSLPVDGAALEAFPNPLASATTVRFGLAEASEVRLVVYDALGREVARLADGPRSAGWHAARFDASGLPSGLYVVRLTAGVHAETIPVTVLR